MRVGQLILTDRQTNAIGAWATRTATLCSLARYVLESAAPRSGSASTRSIRVPGPISGTDPEAVAVPEAVALLSSSRLLLDSSRPMIGWATTLAACSTPMINRIPPIRVISCSSCAPVDRSHFGCSTNVTVNSTNDEDQVVGDVGQYEVALACSWVGTEHIRRVGAAETFDEWSESDRERDEHDVGD